VSSVERVRRLEQPHHDDPAIGITITVGFVQAGGPKTSMQRGEFLFDLNAYEDKPRAHRLTARPVGVGAEDLESPPSSPGQEVHYWEVAVKVQPDHLPRRNDG
jgi:hypothetical protein